MYFISQNRRLASSLCDLSVSSEAWILLLLIKYYVRLFSSSFLRKKKIQSRLLSLCLLTGAVLIKKKSVFLFSEFLQFLFNLLLGIYLMLYIAELICV